MDNSSNKMRVNEDKIDKQKRNIIIFILIALLAVLIVSYYFLYLKKDDIKGQGNEASNVVENQTNKYLAYRISNNGLQDFDLYFTEVNKDAELDSNTISAFRYFEGKKYTGITTEENRKVFLDFINDNYSINAKIFIIGIFKKSIDEDKTYMNMNEFLGKKGCNYEYYEMYDGDLNKIDFDSQEFENAENMNNIFKEVFTEIYAPGQNKKNGGVDEKNEGVDKSIKLCNIF